MEKEPDKVQASDASLVTALKEPNVEDAEKRSTVGDVSIISEPNQADEGHITGFKLFIVLAALTLIIFLMMLDTSIIATAIPKITSDFHSLHDVGWYGSSYLLASCTLQPLTGKIYTQFKTKHTFLIFFGIFEFGSALCGAAQSSTMLIIGRAIAGIGGSGLSNGGLTIIAASAPMHRRPALVGIMLAISQIGTICGPVIGGVLTEYTTWRWCFFVNLPIGAVAAILLVFIPIQDESLRKRPGSPKPTDGVPKSKFRTLVSDLDLFGFVIFAGFAIMILLALQWGGAEYAWSSPTIIGLFVGGGCTFIIFAAYEYRVGDGAMIPWSMVKQTIVWSSSLTIFFFFGTLMVFSYYMPIYFQTVRGVSPALSGVYVLPGVLGQMLLAAASGVIMGKLGYYLPWSIASAIIVSIAAGLISTLTPHSSTATWVLFQLLGGIGRGCGFQIPIVALQNTLPPSSIPVGMALLMFTQSFGGSIILSFAQTIFNSSLKSGLAKYAPDVDAQTVIRAGASAVRNVVSAQDLPGVLEAYTKAVNHEFYLAAGCSVGAFVVCFGMGWRKIEKKQAKTPATAVPGEEV